MKASYQYETKWSWFARRWLREQDHDLHPVSESRRWPAAPLSERRFWWGNNEIRSRGRRQRTVGWCCMKSTRSFHRQKPISQELGSEWVSGASEQMSAGERASEASSAEQVNEWAVRANERADGRVNDRVLYASISYPFNPERIDMKLFFRFSPWGDAILSLETWWKERNRWLTCWLTTG